MEDIKLGPLMDNLYRVEAYRDGELLWVEEYWNLVVAAGLNELLDKFFKGSGYTAAFYVGLTGNAPTVADGDTMASHAGWTEVVAYAEAARQTLTLGTVAAKSVNNSASKAVFTVNADNTVIGGAFVTTNSTKGGSTGILYGGGAFAAARTLMSGDVLNVTITLTASGT